MNRIFPVLAILVLVSCRQPANEIVINTGQKKEGSKFSKGVKSVDVEIGDTFTGVPANLSKNLYGKFFYDRAEYYIIENPTNQIWGKGVLKTTLYYFDGQLYKVKHLMQDDISYNLINQRPQFKVKALDSISRRVLKSQAVVFRMDNKLTLNDNLSHYELTWLKDEKQIKWKTSLEGNGKLYEYSESFADYKKKYRELEVFESRY
jgi:hypothetical protein